MSQSNKRSYEPRRSEYRPMNSAPQRPAQPRPQQPRPAQPRPQQGNAQRPAQPRPQPPRPVQPPRPQQSRSSASYAAPRKQGFDLPYGFGKLLVICAVVIIVAVALQLAFPNGLHPAGNKGEEAAARSMVSQIYSNGPVRINEVMTSNQRTISLVDGSSPDWIEIANIGSNSVNLKDYSLSKAAGSVNVFTFPEMTLNSGECVLLYADSKLSETAEREMHVPFRISSAGDTLMLFNAGGTAIDTVNIPALTGDHSYVRIETSKWEESSKPTPGAFNTEQNYIAMHTKSDNSPVIVNEIMAVNHSAYAAQDGLYYDYIELYNRTGETVDLSGWYLSDDEEYIRKWRFPETVIAPGEYVVVFASGLDMREDLTQLHANFLLSSEGEPIILCDADGRIMDRVDFDLMKPDVAYALQADGSWINTSGTPAAAN